MKLLSITLQNFMPYKGTQKLVFPTGSANVVVIYGDNMRGKTSLLNAIRYAFFGHATSRGARQIKSIDLINVDAIAEGDWTLSVSVEFSADGSMYELRRELVPAIHVARPTNDDDLKEWFVLRKDGIPLTGQDLAFEMNQVMPEGISRFFLFDGELLQEYEILVRDEGGTDKIKQAIEDVLGVPALTKGRDEIRTLLDSAQNSQAQDLRHLRTLQAQAEQQIALQKTLSALRTAHKSLADRKTAVDDDIAKISERLEQFEGAAELTKKLNGLEGDLKQNFAKLAEQRVRRADLLQDAWKDLVAPQVDLLRRDLITDRDKALQRLGEHVAAIARAAELRGGITDGICPMCGQKLDAEHRSHLSTQLGEIEGRIAALVGDTNLGSIHSRIDLLNRTSGPAVADRVVAVEKEMRFAAVRSTEITREIESVKAELSDFDDSEMQRLRAERDQLITLSGSLERELQVKSVDIITATRKLDQVSRLLTRNPEARGKRSSRLVATYGALERVYSASIDKLRERQRARVEDYATSAFKKLTTEPDYSGLSINENYGLMIMDAEGRNVAERSAGAEQVVALALIDGLNKAGRRGGPIVMDTPFGRLDFDHRRNVLRYLPEMAEQVILLVHEGEMDPTRDLGYLKEWVGARYRIERITARQSRLVSEPLGPQDG